MIRNISALQRLQSAASERVIIVAPSILAADFGHLADELRAVDAAGTDWIHVAIMDGRFVSNITIGPLVVEAVARYARKAFNVHLMIVEPERYLAVLVNAAAAHVLVHAERSATNNLYGVLSQIRRLGKKAGVALAPESPIEHVLNRCDIVLAVTVKPGFGGRKVLAETLSNISRLREFCEARRLDPIVEVDRGENRATAGRAIAAGVIAIVAGSAIFGSHDYTAASAAVCEARDPSEEGLRQ